ncbi:MAG: hypothetical protein LH481_10595 [Burkholderiales bacterium]|nr:hypothetical protein [Burkholderiales bacterium]
MVPRTRKISEALKGIHLAPFEAVGVSCVRIGEPLDSPLFGVSKIRLLSSVEPKYVSGGDIVFGPGGSWSISGGGQISIYSPGSPQFDGGVQLTGFTGDGWSVIEYVDGTSMITDPSGGQHNWDPEAGGGWM